MKSQKRSLFKQPAWAKSSVGEDGDIFRRSNRVYSDVDQNSHDDLAHGEKALHSSKIGISSEQDLDDDKTEATKGQQDNVATYASSIVNQTMLHTPIDHQSDDDANESRNYQSASLLQGYSAVATKGARSTKRKLSCGPPEIVNLEEASKDSSTIDESSGSTSVRFPYAQPGSKLDHEYLEDEEFPELARLARERARRKRLEQDLIQESMKTTASGLRSISSAGISILEIMNYDPTVQILVTSEIEHAQPLIITRRLSQRLKDVKLAWIQHQRPECGPLDHIFLTWRGKRVYDITSCQSLGFKKENANGVPEDQELTRIHMVAMTRETFDHIRQVRDRRLDSAEDDDEKVPLEPKAVAEVDKQIRIILQSRNFSDFKLAVKQSTPISKIVNVFRSSKQIDVTKEVFLQFDGERLGIDGTVGETELADLDNLEVYVK